MARQKTQNIFKCSPNALRTQRRSPKSTFRLPKRSPLTSRLNRPAPIGGSRFFHTRPKLQPIHEEHFDRGFPLDLRPEFAANLGAYEDEQIDVNGQDDGGIFDWEEEQTLVAALLQDESAESERDKITELANSLQGPMSNQSFKQHFAEMLVPTYTLVKDAFVELDQKIDFAFAEGIFTFDDSSKAMEILVIKEEDEVKASYSKTKNNIKTLFVQLDQLHKQREKLWADLQETLNHSAESILAEVNTFPAAIERKISALDKLNKDMDKDNGESVKQEKMLKVLLAKFA